MFDHYLTPLKSRHRTPMDIEHSNAASRPPQRRASAMLDRLEVLSGTLAMLPSSVTTNKGIHF